MARVQRQEAGDRLWKALADPTRREILDLLRLRPRTTGELAEAFPTSRFAVMKHLTVLADAGLVVARRRWRERWNHLNAVPLQELYERWVKPYEAVWASGLVALKERVESPDDDQGDIMANAQGNAGTVLGTADVELEIPIEASRERVWNALVHDIGVWWRKDFIGKTTVAFVLEPKPGGRVYEDFGGGQGRLWYNVVTIEAPVTLQLVGQLMPENCGGSLGTSLLRITLDEAKRGHTLVKLSDSVFGRLRPDLAPDLTEGWQQLIRDALKPYVEGKMGQ